MLLREILQKKSPVLYGKFINLEGKARPLLEYSQGGSHLYYTPHGLSHITAVEDNYDWLLSNEDMEGLNAAEIFVLLSATYFHDAMMIPKYQGDEEEARKNHAARASNFVTKHCVELGLQLNESVAVGNVIEGHAINTLDALSEPMVLGNCKVEIRKLAACLSLSDICHADESRAPWIVRTHLELDEESDYHWSRHLQISGITRDNNDLIMSAIAFSKDGEEAINEYKAMIETQLKICRPYFQTILQPLNSVKLNITRLKSPFEQSFVFNTNMPEILNLLISGVYSKKDVFVRELVQNSLDACMIRQARSRKANITYNPQIVLTLYLKEHRLNAIRIDDNGIGMSIKDVRDTLLWIGSSIGKNSNIASLVQETMGKQLIATFGIGMLSCFRVSSKISVASCKENETPLQFSIKNISDTIVPKESNDLCVGSTFYVEFDINKYNVAIKEMLDSFLYYFREINQAKLQYIEMPFDENSLAKTRKEIFTMASSEGSAINSSESDISDALYQKTIAGENYSGVFWISNSNDINLLLKKGKLQILNEGIFVKEDSIDNWLPSHISVFNGILNISAKVLDLTASRDLILENEKSIALRRELRLKSTSLFEGLVKTQARKKSLREKLSLIIMDMIRRAEKNDKDNILRKLDFYCVRTCGPNNYIELKNIPNIVYVEYKIEQYASELTTFEGKTLYHIDREFAQLQTLLLLQSGQLIISAINFELKGSNSVNSLREIDLITQYCKLKGVKVIDLVRQNVITEMYHSAQLNPVSGNLVSPQVKFVDMPILSNQKIWKVKDQIWVNISNDLMGEVYSILNDPKSDMTKKIIAKAIIDCLSYKFDDVISSLQGLIRSLN